MNGGNSSCVRRFFDLNFSIFLIIRFYSYIYYIFHNFLLYFRFSPSNRSHPLLSTHTFHLDNLACSSFGFSLPVASFLFLKSLSYVHSYLIYACIQTRDKCVWSCICSMHASPVSFRYRHIMPSRYVFFLPHNTVRVCSKHSNKEHSHCKKHISFKFSGMSFRVYALLSLYSSFRFTFASFDAFCVRICTVFEREKNPFIHQK